MKKLLAMIALVSTQGLAAYNGALIVHTNHSGYTTVEWRRSEICEVHMDKVVINRQFDQVVVSETRPLSMTPAIQEMIQAAAQAEVEVTDNFMCDGPSSYVKANMVQPDDSVEVVELYSTGGCGAPKRQRTGGQAFALRAIVGAYCTTLH